MTALLPAGHFSGGGRFLLLSRFPATVIHFDPQSGQLVIYFTQGP